MANPPESTATTHAERTSAPDTPDLIVPETACPIMSVWFIPPVVRPSVTATGRAVALLPDRAYQLSANRPPPHAGYATAYLPVARPVIRYPPFLPDFDDPMSANNSAGG